MARSDRANINSNSYRDETQAELDFLDGATAGSVVNSKALIYGAAGQVAATTLAVSGNATLGDAAADAHTVNGTLAGAKVLVESVTVDDALTVAESGKIFVFADAAATLTLPDSGGGDITGTTYKFISNYQGTGQKVVCTDTTNEDMIGNLIGADNDGDGAPLCWNAQVGDTFSSINMNSVAQGKPGSMFTVTNIAADVWLVEGVVSQSGGSEATPFATS